MPHSSGGGSHGGGYHSSSHSSGGSSGSGFSSSSSSAPSPQVSHAYFSGATRYVYYDRRGTMHNLYAKNCYSKPDTSTTVIACVIVSLLAAGLVWFLLTIGIFIPKPLDTTKYNSGVVIDDHLSLLSTTELQPAMEKFLATSGVSPAVEIVGETEWQGNYKNLETFALSEYMRMFDDEKHWLVVVSFPEDYKGADFVNWKWEGIIGDECGSIIRTSDEDLFTETVQRELLRSEPATVGDHLALAYTSFLANGMQKSVSKICVVGSALAVALALFIVVYSIRDHSMQSRVYHDGIRVRESAKESNCEYCGNLYVVGTIKSCPHCGAPIPAEEKQAS